MPDYKYKLVKTTKDHDCYICNLNITRRSFVIQRDENPNVTYGGRVIPPFPSKPVRAHLSCFDASENPQTTGLEPTLSVK